MIDCGWKDRLKTYCKGFLKIEKNHFFIFKIELIRKKGLEKVTIDELVDELIIRGYNFFNGKNTFKNIFYHIFDDIFHKFL